MASQMQDLFKFTADSGVTRGPFFGYQIREMIMNGTITADAELIHAYGEGKTTVGAFMKAVGADGGTGEIAVSNWPKSLNVMVRDFDMPFGSLIGMMIKWALAAIPAALILAILWFVVGALLMGVFQGIAGR